MEITSMRGWRCLVDSRCAAEFWNRGCEYLAAWIHKYNKHRPQASLDLDVHLQYR